MDRRSLIAKALAHRRPLLIVLALFVFFYGMYLNIGLSLAETSAFKEMDILFGADTPRVIDDIATFSADHHRTSVHPLYVLLVNPWGCFVKKLLHSKIAAAVAINSFFGAYAVCLALVFFLLLSGSLIDSAILSCIFGFSMSQLFFSSVPETSSLATCSLIITYIIFLVAIQRKRPYPVLWVIAGILTLGVTTTNFAQTLICFIVTLLSVHRKEKDLRLFAMIRPMMFAIFITALFSIIQKMAYPSSRLFFTPAAYREEINFLSLFIIRRPIAVLHQLAKHFMLVNVIAPLPDLLAIRESRFPLVTFENSWNYSIAGWVGLVAWVCALAAGIARAIRDRQKMNLFFVGISLCFFFNILLHSIYNGGSGRIEVFLYTGNCTFPLIILLGNYTISKKLFTRTLSVALLLLIAFNNISVMRQLLVIYK